MFALASLVSVVYWWNRPKRTVPETSVKAASGTTGDAKAQRPARSPFLSNSKDSVASYKADIEPMLKTHCYTCHGEGEKSGNLAFDQLNTDSKLLEPGLWLKVLKNVRAGIMPPPGQPKLAAGDVAKMESWIKACAFNVDEKHLDPGRVTLRRLNRNEYQNAVRDLLGVEISMNEILPPDDVGYGFDNIGDVLSISPMRLEKFMEAAITVVDKAAPKDTLVMPSVTYLPADFKGVDGRGTGDSMSFYQARTVNKTVKASASGEYNIHIYCKIDGDTTFDPQECRIHVTSDGKEFFTQQYHYSDNEWFETDSRVQWEAGDHVVAFTTEPVHPELQPLRTKMDYRIVAVRFDGPIDRKSWVHPPGYERLYTRDVPPTGADERRAYAREILQRLASKAFRRPVAESTLDQLVAMAERTYSAPGATFESGIAQALTAVLCSPRFLFHVEGAEAVASGETFPLIDEYSLAARLSFALWCSIPDDELMRLAGEGQLRKNFAAQVKRMLADSKAQSFVENFSQQWLQTRSILDIPINAEDILSIEAPMAEGPAMDGEPLRFVLGGRGGIGAGPGAGVDPAQTVPGAGAAGGRGAAGGAFGGRGAAGGRGGFGRGGQVQNFTGLDLTPEVRMAMKKEVESYFDYVMRQDRSTLEFLDSRYTFVNAALAPVYGIPNITGLEMRKVDLPSDNPRGGFLTMGSVLTVTSNPTRTSPVKRGKWILENILGAPTAPPPPNVPALEDSLKKDGDKRPTQREVLAIHREDAMCASCHQRMDPLGLAMENFNGFGRFRAVEFQQKIDPSGELITGEKFSSAAELKKSLVTNHKLEFYRTLTGKLLTYVLGRGMEYYDVATIDTIVAKVDLDNGRFSTMLLGVLESAPVQRCRPANGVDSSKVTSGKGE